MIRVLQRFPPNVQRRGRGCGSFVRAGKLIQIMAMIMSGSAPARTEGGALGPTAPGSTGPDQMVWPGCKPTLQPGHSSND